MRRLVNVLTKPGVTSMPKIAGLCVQCFVHITCTGKSERQSDLSDRLVVRERLPAVQSLQCQGVINKTREPIQLHTHLR